MSCSFLNRAPFMAASFPHESKSGEPVQIVVVKGTWTLSSSRFAPPAHQAPVRMLDESVKLEDLELENEQRQVIASRGKDVWLSHESDMTPPKSCFDLIVNAYAQDKGKRFHQLNCSVHFNQRRLLSLLACSPRIWSQGLLGPVIKSSNTPVAKVPAFDVFAFGGCANRPVDPAQNPPETSKSSNAPKHWPANQNGMGYCTNATHAVGVALPWLETPNHLIKLWSDCPPVAALGHLSRADQPRVALMGARDPQAGSLPADFDWRSFNAAPFPLQLTERPKPEDTVQLEHLSPSGDCVFTFPNLRLWAMGQAKGGSRLEPVELFWDTLVLEPEMDCGSLVWRAALPDAGRKLNSITLLTESGAAS